MATNEHKNLSNDNIHLPLDFSTAGTNTVLTKNGSSEIEWMPESHMRVDYVKIQGYGTAGSGDQLGEYLFRNNMTDGQSPYQMGQDYGSATVGGATIDPQDIIRCQADVVNAPAELYKITGWGTANGTPTITIAICKLTLTDNSSTNITPVLLEELTFTGAGNDTPRSFSSTEFTVSSLAAGDLIFPMIKGSLASNTIYFNLTIETRNT